MEQALTGKDRKQDADLGSVKKTPPMNFTPNWAKALVNGVTQAKVLVKENAGEAGKYSTNNFKI